MVNKTSKLVHALMMVMYMTVAFLVHAEDVKSAEFQELFASANNDNCKVEIFKLLYQF